MIDLYRAFVYGDEGRLIEARQLARRVLPIFEEAGLGAKAIVCRLLLARLALRIGDWQTLPIADLLEDRSGALRGGGGGVIIAEENTRLNRSAEGPSLLHVLTACLETRRRLLVTIDRNTIFS